MSRKRTPKAKVLKIFDEQTMTTRTVYLHRATFTSGHVVECYGPDVQGARASAERLYANKGAFGSLVDVTAA